MQFYETDETEKQAITQSDAEENISTGEEKPEESQMPTRKPVFNAKLTIALRRWGLPGLLLICFVQGLNINIPTPFGDITVQTQHSLMQVIEERFTQ